MFNQSDIIRNGYRLDGSFASQGYDWWWHSLTGISEETGEEKQFFVEYFLCNPNLGGKDPVPGQLPVNRELGIKPSYLMVKAGCWGEDHMQLHRFFGWEDVKVKKTGAYAIVADDCYAGEKRIRGRIKISEEENAEHPEWMCDSGSMEWDLKIEKKIAFNVGYGAGALFRKLKAFEMYWHAEGMKTFYSGRIRLGDKFYRVIPEKSYGYADKNWGRDFTSPWIWLSSWDLTSTITGRRLENSVFDIGGGKPKAFGISLPRKLLGAFYYEGMELEYNFSKFWMLPGTYFKAEELENEIVWNIKQENATTVMETEVHCLKKDMLLVNYEAPNGKKLHNRLWNGGNGTGTVRIYLKTPEGLNLIDDIRVGHIGCEFGEYDHA